ncbi:MAG TPA: hypothetical protein VIN36_08320 [Thiobacillus sp.]
MKAPKAREENHNQNKTRVHFRHEESNSLSTFIMDFPSHACGAFELLDLLEHPS